VNGAETLGYPVVLKILSPDIAHKSDVGGVKINLGNAAEVRAAWAAIMQAAASAAPHAVIHGAVVAKMISGGVETIIGVHRDPTFGPMVMFGMGGVAVELYGDVAFRPAPLTRADAEKMIRSIKGFALLSGFRGKPAVNLAQLVDVVVSVGRLAAADSRIASAEINPFIALPDGGLAVDALVLKQRNAQGPTQ
jgi:acyl-CoA synthetase (NDP forming)